MNPNDDLSNLPASFPPDEPVPIQPQPPETANSIAPPNVQQSPSPAPSEAAPVTPPQPVSPVPTAPNGPVNAVSPVPPRPEYGETSQQAPTSQPTLPQPMPAVPSYPASVTTTPPGHAAKKSRRWLIPVGLVAVVIVLGVGVWLASSHQENPDTLFRSALETGFSTKTVKQTSTDGRSTGLIEYDLTNVKAPKNSVAADVPLLGDTLKVKGYGTLQNQYFAVSSFGDRSLDHAYAGLENKWVSIRQNGVAAPGVDSSFAQLADPRMNDLGDFIFGNFSASDRQTLTDYVITNQVYKYDPKQVVSAMLNGKKVLVYTITENAAKLKVLNQKAAAMMGLSSNDIQDTLDQVTQNGNMTAKLYIETGSKQLVRVTLNHDGQAVTNVYSDYNATSLPAEPKANLTWQQFQGQENSPSTGSTTPPPNTAII